MGAKKPPFLGRLAVQQGLLTPEQLAAAVAEHERGPESRRFGAVLVELGLLSQPQLAELASEQKRLVEELRARKAGGAAGPPAEPPRRAAAPQTPSPEAAPQTAPAAPQAARTAEPAAPAQGQALDTLLRQAVEQGASDIHVHSGAPLQLRLAGALTASGSPLPPEQAESLLFGALGPQDQALLRERGELDLCHTVRGVGRFRANLYRQQAGYDGVFRYVPPKPPSLAELGLPGAIEKFVDFNQGMVLVTGPTGCGKTSTMAALLDLVNERRPDHILTVEDPIEYVHPSKRALVNQRSVERHTGSFARALRAALREDPDVIVIGELRDVETISLALTAAETGHFVLATLHTGSSIRTINRLVGAFPSNQQGQVRTMLSESLRAVISQRLLPRADGQGRAPAIETLVVNRAVANLIRENKTFQIQSILQTGGKQGMITLDQSIRQLLSEGVISEEQAKEHLEESQEKAA